MNLSSRDTSEEMGKEGRRSPRIVARIPLDVQPVQESAAAVTAVINIRNQKTNRSIRAQVVWTGPDDGTGSYKLGVEFEDAESGFWGGDYSVSGK